jgi:hypothetical protein
VRVRAGGHRAAFLVLIGALSACGASPAAVRGADSSNCPTRSTCGRLGRGGVSDTLTQAPRALADYQVSSDPIAAGDRFELVLLLRLDPGVWIPWSADAGFGAAPTLVVEGPPGFRFGPLRLPGPERVTLAFGKPLFGYAGLVAGFVSVEAPVDLPAGERVLLEVLARWTTCARRCQEEERRSLVWLEAGEEGVPLGLEGELLAERDALPVAFEALGGTHSWEDSGGSPRLVLSLPAQRGRLVELIPLGGSPLPSATRRRGERLQLAFASPPERVSGLVAVRRGGQTRFGVLNVER